MMLPWLSLILGTLGFAGLALAMPRHHEQALRRKPGVGRRWLCRALGLALLAGSLWLACRAWSDAAIAVTAWLGIATVAAFGVGMALTWRGS